MNTNNPHRQRGRVKSADRTLEILEFFGRQRGSVAHAEISRALGIPKSSASALLGNLVDRDYLNFHPETNGYRLGAAVIALASGYLRELDLPRLGQAAVQSLAAQVSESAALAVLAGSRVQVVARHNWEQPLMYSVNIGDTAPLHASASGKAILAALPAQRRDALLRGYRFEAATARTLRSRRELILSLDTAQAAGFTWADEELVDGIVTVAAAVVDAREEAVAAISLSIPVPRLPRYRLADLARHVCDSARSLSRDLGARPAHLQVGIAQGAQSRRGTQSAGAN